MFNVGDTVMLKSGGPVMTVTGKDFGDNLICTWFDSKQELKTGSFPPSALDAWSDDD
ncbi:YodC family protein [Vibrio fluvialis]